MDPVQITMLGVAVALAALIVAMNGSLRRDMDKRFEGVNMRFDALGKRIDGIEKRFDNRFDGIDARLGSVEDEKKRRSAEIDASLGAALRERLEGLSTGEIMALINRMPREDG